MIKLSYTAVADFMLASPTKQRKTLLNFKYPNEDEPLAMRLYYKEARDAIRDYHKGIKTQDWLEDIAGRLCAEADLVDSPHKVSRLKNNARTLQNYARHFKSAGLHILPAPKAILRFGNVEIRVTADLHGSVGAKRKFLRLEHGKEALDPDYLAIVGQIMLEAFSANGNALPANSYVIRHVASGTDYAPARIRSRRRNDIMATCENIAAIWDTL